MDPAVVLPCRALLFDCDGVLVDSDESVARSWTRWALDYGLDPASVTALVHGRRSVDTVHMLIPPGRRAAALRTINAYELEDARTVPGVAGAAALVTSLPRFRWAVVTSGTPALARARLSAAGIPLPKVLITAADVSRGKPDPEGYLAAAGMLDAPPETTVVLEDSRSGVEAGRRAGVTGVIGVSAKALDTDADIVVGDLTCVAWTDSALAVYDSGLLRPARWPPDRR